MAAKKNVKKRIWITDVEVDREKRRTTDNSLEENEEKTFRYKLTEKIYEASTYSVSLKKKINNSLMDEYKKMGKLNMYEINEKGELGEYTNPLMWWKSNQIHFPTLAKLARRILCIPATSAPSERGFFAAGIVISKFLL